MVLLIFIASTTIGSLYVFRNLKVNAIKLARSAVIKAPPMEQLAYAQPYALWGLMNWLHLSADKWLIGNLHDAATLGEYSYLYQFGLSPISTIVGAIFVYLSPIIYANAKNGEASNLKNADRIVLISISIIVITAILLSCIVFLLQESVMTILIGKHNDSYQYLYLFTIAGFVLSLQQPANMLLNNRLLSNEQNVPKLATAGIGIVSMIGLIALWGPFVGAPLAIIACSLIYIFWILIIFRNKQYV